MKSVQIRSFFESVFSCIRTEYRKIRTRNNSVFGHFSRSGQYNNKYQNENENQSTSCEKCNNENHGNMNECSECKKWIHYECTDLPRYMICSLTKGKRKFSCQNCVGNDEISKYTKMFNKKELYNEEEINNTVNIEIQIEITTEEKEMKNLLSIENLLKSMKLLLEEKEHKINILEETQSKTETTISVMKEEIENFKNEKKKI